MYNKFDIDLFNYLSKGQPIKLLRFDGSKKGNEIHIQFPLNQKWVSVITKDEITDNEAYFIDEGKQLPFGLTTWEHKHRILNKGNDSEILDDITYTAPSLIGIIFFIPLYLPMYLRKKQYLNFFK